MRRCSSSRTSLTIRVRKHTRALRQPGAAGNQPAPLLTSQCCSASASHENDLDTGQL